VLHRADRITGLLGQHRGLSICPVGNEVKPAPAAETRAISTICA
jgi:hypothetical protein